LSVGDFEDDVGGLAPELRGQLLVARLRVLDVSCSTAAHSTTASSTALDRENPGEGDRWLM